MWLIDVMLNILFLKLCYNNGSQRNEIYQALTSSQWDNFMVGFGVLMRLVDNEINTEYHQTYPLKFRKKSSQMSFARIFSFQENKLSLLYM